MHFSKLLPTGKKNFQIFRDNETQSNTSIRPEKMVKRRIEREIGTSIAKARAKQ